MGNENSLLSNSVKSNINSKTFILLDDSACWQLHNRINEQSEPISSFTAKQTFTVECRRSIQFLKTIRHPSIIKFISGFKTYSDQDSFVADCVYPLSNKLNNNEINSIPNLSLGLYQLIQGLEFLHTKTSISHNNVSLPSIYVSLSGLWKLGNFECASRYNTLNKKYLATLSVIRAEECVTPEEVDQNVVDLNPQLLYSIDIYGFGRLIETFLSSIEIENSMKQYFVEVQTSMTVEDPESRPHWSTLLKTQLFQIDYIKITEILDRLPTVEESGLDQTVESLSNCLDQLPMEYFDESLVHRLLSPFMFLCSKTRLKIVPRVLVPKSDTNQSWIISGIYEKLVIPLIIDLFSYHVTSIRETILEHFQSYWQLIDRTIIVTIVLPQLIYGLKDSNNTICALTLSALALMVPVLGGDVVVGGQRKTIFADTLKKESVTFPSSSKRNLNNNQSSTKSSLLSRTSTPTEKSPSRVNRLKLPTREKIRSNTLDKTPRIENELLKNATENSKMIEEPLTFKQTIPIQTNTNLNLLTTVQDDSNDEQINDEDEDRWSDWEQHDEPSETTNYSEITSNFFIEESNQQKINERTFQSPTITTRTNPINKPKWDPDAPLGKEYEIPSISTKNKNSSNKETKSTIDDDDFFKDMAPKLQTVQLMEQLENMFTNQNPKQENVKQTSINNSNDSLKTDSNKFGILNNDNEEQIETNNENNWED